jgi:FixH
MQKKRPGEGRSWQLILAALVALFLVGMVSSLVIASKRVSRIVDADYYSHGLHYGETRIKTGTVISGWNMTTSIAGDHLQVTVLDGAGTPVTGGRITFEPLRRTGGGSGADFRFVECSPGKYRAIVSAGHDRDLRGTMRFSRGDTGISGNVALFN